MREIAVAARLYVGAVITLGVAITAWSALSVENWANTAGLLLLMLALERIGFHATSVAHDGTFTTMTLPVAAAAFMVEGPDAAALVGALALFIRGHEPSERNGINVKRAFNAANFAISAFVGGWVYVALGGPVGELQVTDFPEVLGPFAAASLAYCAITTLLLLGVLVLVSGARPGDLLRGPLLQTTPAMFGYSFFGLMIAVLWLGSGIGATSVVLVLAPLMIARWAIGQYAREREAYEATIRTLIRAVETKDEYTRGHSERVAMGSVMIGRVLGLVGPRLDALRYAGILHDVGKLGVPTRILQKTGRLTDEEFAAITLHPVRGRDLVADLEFLGEALSGVLHHHERLDGRGYPMGLRGEDIPEFARIIAVADAFDSMTSTRSYRGARSVEEALEEIRRCSGSQFDPRMVEAMLLALQREPWAERTGQLEPRKAAGGLDHDDPTVAVGRS